MNPGLPGRATRPVRPALALISIAMIVAPLARAEAELEETVPEETEAIEEMLVIGEVRPKMDVLAGATTTRIETDVRLTEGAQIDDLLAEVPGVQIRRFGGVGERFEISIRGSTPEQVPVFLDGVRLDSSLTGRSDLSTICLDVLEEIQVTRGAGAARAGSGAIGGVVNLVSRRAPEEPETRLRLAGGNFGSVEGSVRHARRIGDWDLSLAYCGFHTEGDFDYQTARARVGGISVGTSTNETRENNEADRHTSLVQVGRKIGDGRFRLTQLLSDLDRGTPGLDTDPRFEADEHDLSILTSAALELPTEVLPDGLFQAGVSHRFEGNHFEDPESGAGADPIDTETTVHSVTARSGGRMGFDALAAEHEFALLAEGRFDQRGANEANSKSRFGIALRVELSSHWLDDRLKVSPSLRFERYDGLDEEWIPGLFVEGHPLEWIDLKASASRSYRIPSFQELYLPDKGFERGNENLSPEKAWNFEVGVVLRSPFDSPWLDAEVEATWFAGEVDESIVFQLVSSNVIAPVNTGSSETRGYELTLRWRPHPWLRLTAARTVTDAKLDNTNENVAGVAVSQTDGRLELGPRERFKVVGEIHYTGRIPLNDGGTAELPSRVTYDASASMDLTKFPRLGLSRFGKSLWLSVRGRNLGNEAVRDSRSFPRPGRNFSVALESVF